MTYSVAYLFGENAMEVSNPTDLNTQLDERPCPIAAYLTWLHAHDRPINICGPTPKGIRGKVVSVAKAIEICRAVKDHPTTSSIWCNVNRLNADADADTKVAATDVESYQFFGIDIDANVAAKGYAATDAEHAETLNVAKRIMEAFHDDLPTPLLVSSGNGHLLLYPIDLPNTPQNVARINRLLHAVRTAFDPQKRFIDVSVSNPDRVFGVVGTVNRNKREDANAGRLHRLRQVIGEYPDREPMGAESFIGWADAYIASGETVETVETVEEPVLRQSAQPLKSESQDATDADRLRLASAYLAKAAGAIEGQKGDLHTFNLAGHLLAYGLTVEQVHTLMMNEWNGRCSPPWESDELMVKVRSAASNGTPRAPKVIAVKHQLKGRTGEVGWGDESASETPSASLPMPTVSESDLVVTDWDSVNGDTEWLWQDRIPIGGVTLIAGIGGVGKSTIGLNLAASMTVDGVFACESPATDGDVILIAGEDAKRVIKNRFIANGGNIKRLHHVEGRIFKGQLKPFDLSDVETVRKSLDRWPQSKLVIIDPIHAFVGDKCDTHKNSDVRRVLTPLIALAEERSIAVVGIIHFGKDSKASASFRISGSSAWRDLSRSVFVATPHKNDKGLNLLVHEKSNYASLQPTLGYRVGMNLKDQITWERVDNMTADEALNTQDSSPKLTDAKEWLESYLSDGPKDSQMLKADASLARYCWDTVRRASDDLRVIKQKVGFGRDGRWMWRLPLHEAVAEDKPF